MIGYIKGTIEEILEDSLLLDHQGIGYQIKVPQGMLSGLSIGTEHKIFTYMYVREDQLALFGFESRQQLHLFELLISVNSIGPKAALAILSELSVSALMLAIVSQDSKAIARAQGVGPKSAQKVILELKDKVAAEDILYQEVADTTGQALDNSELEDARQALMGLGFDASTVARALSKVEDAADLDSGQIMKLALKMMK